eukprot:3276202-Amphidinium_carterae.2
MLWRCSAASTEHAARGVIKPLLLAGLAVPPGKWMEGACDADDCLTTHFDLVLGCAKAEQCNGT